MNSIRFFFWLLENLLYSIEISMLLSNVCASHSELIFNFINGFLPYALHIIFFQVFILQRFIYFTRHFFPKSKHKCKRATQCIFFALKNDDKKHVLTSYRYENGHKWKTNSQQMHFVNERLGCCQWR